MANHCELIIKVISLIRMILSSLSLIYSRYFNLSDRERGRKAGYNGLAAEFLTQGSGVSFQVSLREEVGVPLMYRMLTFALNISPPCLFGLQIRKGKDAEFIATIICVESDLRDIILS